MTSARKAAFQVQAAQSLSKGRSFDTGKLAEVEFAEEDEDDYVDFSSESDESVFGGSDGPGGEDGVGAGGRSDGKASGKDRQDISRLASESGPDKPNFTLDDVRR